MPVVYPPASYIQATQGAMANAGAGLGAYYKFLGELRMRQAEIKERRREAKQRRGSQFLGDLMQQGREEARWNALEKREETRNQAYIQRARLVEKGRSKREMIKQIGEYAENVTSNPIFSRLAPKAQQAIYAGGAELAKLNSDYSGGLLSDEEYKGAVGQILGEMDAHWKGPKLPPKRPETYQIQGAPGLYFNNRYGEPELFPGSDEGNAGAGDAYGFGERKWFRAQAVKELAAGDVLKEKELTEPEIQEKMQELMETDKVFQPATVRARKEAARAEQARRERFEEGDYRAQRDPRYRALGLLPSPAATVPKPAETRKPIAPPETPEQTEQVLRQRKKWFEESGKATMPEHAEDYAKIRMAILGDASKGNSVQEQAQLAGEKLQKKYGKDATFVSLSEEDKELFRLIRKALPR